MEHFSSPNEETTSENPSASTYRGGIELSLQNISNSSSASGSIVSVDGAVSDNGDLPPGEWIEQYIGENTMTNDLSEDYRYHGMGRPGGKYDYDTLRPKVRELAEWDDVEIGGGMIGKVAYEADSHASDPKNVKVFFVCNYASDTCQPGRPMQLGCDGEFDNPSLKAAARVWISILVEHGFNWDVARNLVYGSIAIVDVVPVLAPYDWSSNASKYTGDESYATAATVMQEPVAELMRVLPTLCPNSVGYFAFGSDAYKAMGSISQLPLPILNGEKIVHPMTIHNKFCDTDQRFTYIKHSCSAMTAAFGMNISPKNIKDINDVIIVTDGMKRKSNERLDSAIRKLDPEEREVELAERRDTYANMPPEERELELAERRDTYANMIPEEKEEKLAERREGYANMPPEKKEVKLAKKREGYANMPPEERELELAERRVTYANMPLEEKDVILAMKREREAERYANMPPEKKELELAKARKRTKQCLEDGCISFVSSGCGGFCRTHAPQEMKDAARKLDRERAKKRKLLSEK